MAYPELLTGSTAVFERWSCERHTSAFVELCAHPEVMRFLGGPQAPAAAETVSSRIAGHWEEHGFGLWAAVDLVTGACLGFSGAARPGVDRWGPEVGGEIEVGWRLARRAWGRGIATEGAQLALGAVEAEFSPSRVISLVDQRNERSMAVALRLRMQSSGTEVTAPIGVPVLIMELRRAAMAA